MTATIAIIEDVRPHGDNLTIVTVAGNEVVANRKEDGSYRWEEGEVCVYVAEGSIIPDEVLQARGYWDEEKGKGLLEGKKGNRVKMRRFAGHESRGLLFKLGDDFTERADTPTEAELNELIAKWEEYNQIIREEIDPNKDYDAVRVQSQGLAFSALWQKHSEYLRIANKMARNDFGYGIKHMVMENIIALRGELLALPFVEKGPEIGDDVTNFFGITEHQS